MQLATRAHIFRYAHQPLFDFSRLTAAERIELAQDLWDSLSPEELDAELPLDDALRAELDRRLEEIKRNPEAGIPWEQARAEIETQLRQAADERKRRGA